MGVIESSSSPNKGGCGEIAGMEDEDDGSPHSEGSSEVRDDVYLEDNNSRLENLVLLSMKL